MLKIRNGAPEADFNFLSLDTEDSDGETYIWCVRGVYNGKVVNRDFTKRAECVRFLFKRRWPHTVLTGVNLAYDLNTLIYRGGFTWKGIYNMGRLITAYPTKEQITRYKLGRHAIKIIELGNWILNTSLQDMCDMFGVEGHIDKHVLGRDGDLSEMVEACASHATTGAACFDYIQKQAHALDARIKTTSSATALDLFMKKYLKPEHQIYDFKNDFPGRFVGWGGIGPDDLPDEDTLEEARIEKLARLKAIGGLCYVGGRCEAFNLGMYGRQSSIDINSSYPFEMKNQPFPDMNTYRRAYPKPGFIPELLDKYEGAAHIRVKAPNMRIPFLHYKHDGKLLFPVGEFAGWYTFPEIREALRLGYKILDCYEAALFEPVKGLFTDYIDGLYKLKETKTTKIMAKLLMNGLSGKMGQRLHDDAGFQILEHVPDDIEIDSHKHFLLNGVVYEYIPPDHEAEVVYVHTAYPLLVAYVTAYARIHLHKTMEAIGAECVKYVDTDSIHADHEAIKRAIEAGKINIHKTALGAWSFDYEDRVLEIRGLKYYRARRPDKDDIDGPVKWYYTIKGVRAKEQPQYWTNKCLRTYRVRKIKTALRSNQRINEFFDVYRRDRLENPKREYTRRDSSAFKFI